MRLSLIFLIFLVTLTSGCIADEHDVNFKSAEGGEINLQTGEHTYEEGEILEIEADPVEGWEFSHWEQNSSVYSEEEKLEYTVEQDATLKPVFEIPAEFELKNLQLDEKTVNPGEPVTVQGKLENTGGSKDSYSVNIQVNDFFEESKEFELEPGQTENFETKITESTEGEHVVTVSDRELDFEVDSTVYISTLNELDEIRDDMSADYALESDIDATETATWNDGRGFQPIGFESNRFAGTFDGNGYTISGLTIDREEDQIGLFGATESVSEIRNLELENVDIEGVSEVGALVGDNEGSIENIGVSGDISGYGQVGGLVGYHFSEDIEDVDVDANVVGEYQKIGGLVGWNNYGNLHQINVEGDIEGGTSTGGIAGQHRENEISNSKAEAEVSGSSWVGGLVGRNREATIKDSYSAGRVTGSGSEIGGISGQNNGDVENSYTRSVIDAEGEYVGALAGSVDRRERIQNSFWSEDLSGIDVGNAGTQISEDEMRDSSTFSNVGWDLGNTWEMREYPQLRSIHYGND